MLSQSKHDQPVDGWPQHITLAEKKSDTGQNNGKTKVTKKKTPRETQKPFMECSVIRMIYDMPIMYSQWMQINSKLSTVASEISTLSPNCNVI